MNDNVHRASYTKKISYLLVQTELRVPKRDIFIPLIKILEVGQTYNGILK